jgi:hypothetical protein
MLAKSVWLLAGRGSAKVSREKGFTVEQTGTADVTR